MQLSRVTIYPIKSLDGMDVESVAITSAGSLRNDRRWAMVDSQGRILNGKRQAAVHLIRAVFTDAGEQVTVTHPAAPEPTTFACGDPALARWLSSVLQQSVTVREDRESGFPDDSEAWGPTIVSTATLAAIASWFPGLDVDQVRRRLRTNLELAAESAFAEDALFAGEGEEVLFQLGSVTLAGSNPCQRCVVPTRDPATGERYPEFAKLFAQQRAATLPATTVLERFDHFYRAAVNTRIGFDQAGRSLQVGDPLVIGRTRRRV